MQMPATKTGFLHEFDEHTLLMPRTSPDNRGGAAADPGR